MVKREKKEINNQKVQDLLIENFAGLQKAMTNMAIKFETLSTQMSNLLEIFELSAKNFVSQGQNPEENKDMLSKIDALLEQNKTLAKGLVTLEEKLKQKSAIQNTVSLPNIQRRQQI
jgi:hypothetical protein